MTRHSQPLTTAGLLTLAYDYERQAWIKDGVYIRCGHPESMHCGCWGRIHEGMAVEPERVQHCH